MENFLRDTKKMKKIKTGELAALIYDAQDTIIGFYIKKGFSLKFKKTTDELFDRMSSAKFPEALKKIIKRAKKEDDVKLDQGFAVVINGFLEFNQRQPDDKKVSSDVVDAYVEVIEKLLKEQSKKLAKTLDLEPDVVREILVIAPGKDYISNEKYVGMYSQRMLRKFYILAGNATEEKPLGLTTTKQVKKLFKKLFGENLLDIIAVHVLLEKREYRNGYNEKQLAVWGLMTGFAAEVIESQDKKHIAELIKYYAQCRQRDESNQRDAARRINISGLPKEDYPKINKVIEKLKDTKIAKYF